MTSNTVNARWKPSEGARRLAVLVSVVMAVGYTILVAYLIRNQSQQIEIWWGRTILAGFAGLLAVITLSSAVILGPAWVVDGFRHRETDKQR